MAEISILGVSSCEPSAEEEDWENKDKTEIVQTLLACRKSLSEEKNKSTLIQKVIHHQLESEVTCCFT